MHLSKAKLTITSLFFLVLVASVGKAWAVVASSGDGQNVDETKVGLERIENDASYPVATYLLTLKDGEDNTINQKEVTVLAKNRLHISVFSKEKHRVELFTADKAHNVLRRQIYSFSTDTFVDVKLPLEFRVAVQPVFSEDASYIAYAFGDEEADTIRLQVYDTESGEAITPLFEHGEERPDITNILALTALFLTKDQQLISVGRKQVKLWSLSSGELLQTFLGQYPAGGNEAFPRAWFFEKEQILTQCILFDHPKNPQTRCQVFLL